MQVFLDRYKLKYKNLWNNLDVKIRKQTFLKILEENGILNTKYNKNELINVVANYYYTEDERMRKEYSIHPDEMINIEEDVEPLSYYANRRIENYASDIEWITLSTNCCCNYPMVNNEHVKYTIINGTRNYHLNLQTIVSLQDPVIIKHINLHINQQSDLYVVSIIDRRDLIHVPPKPCNSDAIINPTRMDINLFDYQRKTINWMKGIEDSVNNKEILSKYITGPYILKIPNYPLYFDTRIKQTVVTPYKEEFTLRYSGGILGDELGLGKCEAYDTPILMFDGTIKMVQDIIVGDCLMGDDSTSRSVLSLARGQDEMYDIIPLKGEKYTVNKEHILCLKPSGFPSISYPFPNQHYKVDWIECNKFMSKTFSCIKQSESNAKMLAYQFLDTIKSEQVLEIAVKDYIKLSNAKKTLLKGYRVPINFKTKQINDPYIFGLLVDKIIPLDYLCNSRENRLKLLAGIIDSGGLLIDNVFDYIQKNEKLIDNVMYLCRSLGFACYKNKCMSGCWTNGEYKEGEYYRVCISGQLEDIPTRCLNKQAKPVKQENNVLQYSFTVMPIGRDNYYGFVLDGNRRYVHGDFTVTHNTLTSIGLILSNPCISREYYTQKYNTPATLIAMPSHLIDQWSNEIETHCTPPPRILSITTMRDLEKVTNETIKCADIVLISFQLLTNPKFNRRFICQFNWYRIMIDEGHELLNDVYPSQIFDFLCKVQSKYRWYISGTPFLNKKIKVLNSIASFLHIKSYTSRLFTKRISYRSYDKIIVDSDKVSMLIDNLYVRNTKDLINAEYQLPELRKTYKMIDFTSIEMDHYNHTKNVYRQHERLRKLCCHMQLSDNDLNIFGQSIKTLDELKELMITSRENEVIDLETKISCMNNALLVIDDPAMRATRTKYLAKIEKIKNSLGYLTNMIEQISDNDTCSICFNDFTTKSMIQQCGHIFCSNCLYSVIQTSKKCPYCRSECSASDIITIEADVIHIPDEQSRYVLLQKQHGTKIANIIEYIEQNTGDDKVLIFCEWDRMLDKINTILNSEHINTMKCNGSVHRRKTIINTFKYQNSSKVLALSLENTASGMNLTEAKHIIFVNIGDSLKNIKTMEDQAISRSYRLGQTEPVNVIYFITKGTVEEDIYNTL
jgi:SNF2 family DNA or RNA helicase